MRFIKLVLACTVTQTLALEVAHEKVKRELSPKESLATALFATNVRAGHSRANVHKKTPSATVGSRTSTKIFTDWAGVPEPVLQQATPELQSPVVPASVSHSAAAASAISSIAAAAPMPALADTGTGYSKYSYYGVLALFVLSFPGIFSLVKRSVKSKVVRKTYEVAGPAAPGGRPTRELGADIVAYFQANNYKITEAADVIVFEGIKAPISGRAAFLTACVFISFAGLALVLTIVEQAAFGGGLGNLWYLGTLLSPIAGKYYMDNAERTDQVTVKIITTDDEMISDVIVQGDDEEIERFQQTLDLREKGMVYVKPILS